MEINLLCNIFFEIKNIKFKESNRKKRTFIAAGIQKIQPGGFQRLSTYNHDGR